MHITELPKTDAKDESSTWIVDEDHPTHGWLVKNACLKEQAYGRGEGLTHDIWLPKNSYAHMPQEPTRVDKPLRVVFKWVPKTKKLPEQTPQMVQQPSIPVKIATKHKWVPTQVVRQQWNGCGIAKIWIPKVQEKSAKSASLPKTPEQAGNKSSQPPLNKPQITYKWVKKTVSQHLPQEPLRTHLHSVEDPLHTISIKQRARHLEMLLYPKHFVLITSRTT